MDSVLGPHYYAFAFEGTAPTNPSEIPFELLKNPSEITGYPLANFRTFNWVNIYNNMIQANFVSTDRPRKDVIAWHQRDVEIHRPKMGYMDASRSKYRHIPQKIDTNLDMYDNNTIVSGNAAHVAMPFIFQEGLSDFNGTYSWYINIPKEDSDFYLDCDFEKDVPIDRIEVSGHTSNHFEGTIEFQQWDATLNEGAGDWVTFTTAIFDQTVNVITFSEVTTSKIRIKFPQGEQTSINTRITEIGFFGANPTVEDTPKTIGWMLLVPTTIKQDYPFVGVHPELPYLISAAGGPLEPREAVFSSESPKAGRANSLLSLEAKFVAKESF